MIEFIRAHHQALSTSASLFTAAIWLVYLNLFYASMRRSRRPEILLSRSAGSGCGARLFIANMGAEPIYVTAIIADYEAGGERGTAYITRNDIIRSEDLETPRAATNEGPLGSGDYLDAGSFADLMTRIEMHGNNQVASETIERLTLTVAAETGYSGTTSAGSKAYNVIREGDEVVFHPEKITTQQLRGWIARRRLHKRLEAEMRDAVSSQTSGPSKIPSRRWPEGRYRAG